MDRAAPGPDRARSRAGWRRRRGGGLPGGRAAGDELRLRAAPIAARRRWRASRLVDHPPRAHDMVRAHVLPSTLFIAFWVVLGLGVFFIAARGGLAGARAPFQRQSRGARRAAGLTFTLLYIGFGIALPVVFLIGDHANANGQVSGIKLNAAEKRGRELFYQHCGLCHTL